MKKLFLALTVVFVTAMSANSQNVASGGFRRAGTKASTRAMQKQEIQAQLGVTEGQAKNVDAIQQNYQLKMRAVKMDTDMSDAERKTALAQLQTARKQELKAVISAEQIAKLDRVNAAPQSKKTKVSTKTSVVKRG